MSDRAAISSGREDHPWRRRSDAPVCSALLAVDDDEALAAALLMSMVVAVAACANRNDWRCEVQRYGNRVVVNSAALKWSDHLHSCALGGSHQRIPLRLLSPVVAMVWKCRCIAVALTPRLPPRDS
jgi:hypothetical protein